MKRPYAAIIRSLRLQRGLTQAALAKLIGKTTGWMSMLEIGKVGLSIENLGALCDALEIDPSELVPRKEKL